MYLSAIALLFTACKGGGLFKKNKFQKSGLVPIQLCQGECMKMSFFLVIFSILFLNNSAFAACEAEQNAISQAAADARSVGGFMDSSVTTFGNIGRSLVGRQKKRNTA